MTVPDLARALLARWRAYRALALRSALEALGTNGLRAALTSLGILFGVASVIAMLAIGRGAEAEILEQMRLLGSNSIVIAPIEEQRDGPAKDDGGKQPPRYSPGLTYADAHAIARVVPHVEAVTGEVVLNTLITGAGRRRSGKVVGVDTSYFRLVNLRVAEGAGFAGPHVAQGRPVAIVGAGVRARFLAGGAPVGQALKVGDVWLTVVGVLEDRPVSEGTARRLGIRDANMDVYVPLPTVLRRYRDRARVTQRDVERASRESDDEGTDGGAGDAAGRAERRNRNQLDRIVVRMDSARYMASAADVLHRLLVRRHNGVTDTEVKVPELLLQQERRTRTIFNVVLGAIASISLVVGGIGIMNIMLASVLERIREIGVRRALGATRRDILAQFLTEAVLISLVGGVAGILVGAATSLGIEKLAGIRTSVSVLSVVLAFGVSVSVGLAFGIIPAWRAARQDPVTCLRHE